MLASGESMIAIASSANGQRSPVMRRLRLAADVAPKSTAVTRKMLTRMVWPMRVPRLLIRKMGSRPHIGRNARNRKPGLERLGRQAGTHRPPPTNGFGSEQGRHGGGAPLFWGYAPLRRRSSSDATSAGAADS